MELSLVNFLLWISPLFALGAIREAFLVLKMMRNGKRVSGVVVRFEADYDNGTPVIEYPVETGERRTFRLSTRYFSDSFQVGQRVPVLYDPKYSKRVVIDRAAHRWADTVLWIVFDVLCLGAWLIATLLRAQ